MGNSLMELELEFKQHKLLPFKAFFIIMVSLEEYFVKNQIQILKTPIHLKLISLIQPNFFLMKL